MDELATLAIVLCVALILTMISSMMYIKEKIHYWFERQEKRRLEDVNVTKDLVMRGAVSCVRLMITRPLNANERKRLRRNRSYK